MYNAAETLSEKETLSFRKIFPIQLLGFFTVLTLFLPSLGCSKKEKEVEEVVVTSLRRDLRSKLEFDQLIEFKESKGKKENSLGGQSDVHFKRGRSRKENTPDQEFNTLNRFEQPAFGNEGGLPKIEGRGGEEDYAKKERKLIFGGEGFDIKDFEDLSDDKLNTNFYSHVRPFKVENTKRSEPEHLDSEDKNIRSDKSLVFHPSAVFSDSKNPLPIELLEKKFPPSKIKTISPEEIPQTKVLLTQDPEGIIKFHDDNETIDLLVGDEKVNIDHFKK